MTWVYLETILTLLCLRGIFPPFLEIMDKNYVITTVYAFSTPEALTDQQRLDIATSIRASTENKIHEVLDDHLKGDSVDDGYYSVLVCDSFLPLIALNHPKTNE